ncbi:MAG: hypothetical protein ABIO70_15990 [Pseudomonadota bacterium]
MPPLLSPRQTAEVVRQVGMILPQSAAFRALPAARQAETLAHTQAIAALLQEAPEPAGDPYAFALADTTVYTSTTPPPGGVDYRKGSSGVPTSSGYSAPSSNQTAASQDLDSFRAEGTAAGVKATGSFLREVAFPSFVAELVKGTFQAIVEASIQQMEAYAQLVQSVVMSANEFRDQNVSTDQARDHLVSKFPNVFQLNIGDSGPSVIPRAGAEFGDLPDFASEFGLSQPISDLDQETIDEQLLPAARDDLARSRQKMLATMVLMGINRIIVTDGRINAKVKFSFTARDTFNRQKMAVDYAQLGYTTVENQGASYDEPYSQDQEGATTDSTARRIVTGAYNYVSKPEIKIQSMSKTDTEGGLQAEGSVMGEVNINFRSETFPLEQMINSDQMLRLNDIQANGSRGTPATAAPETAPAPPAPASPAPVAPVG